MFFSEQKVQRDAILALWALYGEIGSMVGR